MPFFEELRRRKVVKVAIAYAIVAWLLLQIASIIFPVFNSPEWVMPVFTILLAFGFPLAIIFAWAFELTPDGVRREQATSDTEVVNRLGGRKLDLAIIVLLSIAVIYFLADIYLLDEDLPDVQRLREVTERSIAVIPFRNRSALPEDVFFVDGIHDDILTRLATVSSFDKVISRTSVERYRDTTIPLPQIGRELGVTTIIEGGVQRSGDRVRINIQLIDVTTDGHEWARTYERELTAENVFAIQAEISEAIVNEMQASLSPGEKDGLEAIPTKSMQALEHYFRGQEQLRKRTSTGIRRALDELQSAVTVDPNFALAHAILAEAYVLAVGYGGLVTPEEADIKAREHITRALALDADLGEAYSALGSIESNVDLAESAYRKAIALSPNNTYAHYNYCWLLGPVLGEHARALERCERALELDPFSPIVKTTTGAVLWGLGRLEEAQTQFERASELDSAFVVSRISLAYLDWFAYAKLDEAAKRLRHAYSLDPDNPNSSASLAFLYLDLGDLERAAFWINEHGERFGDDSYHFMLEAYLYARQGEIAKAADLARRVFDPQNRFGTAWTLAVISADALERGDLDEAREVYAQMYPELFDDGTSELTLANVRAAVDLAFVLYRNGEQQRADMLINLARRHVDTMPRSSATHSSGIADVQIHAMLGNSSSALSSLRGAIDDGWRELWWLPLLHDPALETLRSEPAFREMVQEIEADMAVQLARIREMEANGELAAIPE